MHLTVTVGQEAATEQETKETSPTSKPGAPVSSQSVPTSLFCFLLEYYHFNMKLPVTN